ncbi:MAG: DUF2818 family protein [Thioalkalispiraceae bacterium]|jgi:hypothetical protein
MTTFLIAAFLLLALLAANLPWLSDRFFVFLPPPGGKKRFWMEFLEWLVFYLLMGLVAFGFEMKTMGGLHSQDWEFYAVTFCLFVVFALPGFVYRHTLKHYFR